MWEKARVVFTIPELRNKIVLTLVLLAIYRVGWQITLPMVDQKKTAAHQEAQQGGLGRLITQAAVFSGSDLNKATIFGLGILPYISASIIFQLLGSVWKPIENLQKEGEAGRRKINEYTRYVTVLLCFVQSWMYVRYSIMAVGQDGSPNFISDQAFMSSSGNLSFGWQVVAVLIMTCGTIFLMWLGEQIDEFGIGNGISLLIMAGILAQMPLAGLELLKNAKAELTFPSGDIGIEALVILAALFFGVVLGVVFITLAQRRIPTQSAKHVRGRRVMGGNKQYLPLRINQSGVMPIIFASSLLMFPGMVLGWLAYVYPSIFRGLSDLFNSPRSFVYNLLYVAMIFFFCYFWTAITFNPKDMADNLKNYGTFIPGHRPGRRTADYLEKVMVRITYVGAAFLSLVAIIPNLISSALGVSFTVASFYGGTGLLIAVSVAFDLVQKIDSHLVMRNYKGLLDG